MKPFYSFIVLILLCTLSLYSCGDSQEKETGMVNEPLNQSKLYGNSNFELPDFSEEAEALVSEWLIFEDFENEMRSFKLHTSEELRSKTERLMVFTDSLTKKIPNDLFASAVLSRLKVVRTRVSLLNEEVNGANIDTLQLQTYMSELNKSVASLIVRINEKVLKDDIDIQRKEDEDKELAKQKRFLDSIYMAEKKDREKSKN